jgi:hypothetical protein
MIFRMLSKSSGVDLSGMSDIIETFDFWKQAKIRRRMKIAGLQKHSKSHSCPPAEHATDFDVPTYNCDGANPFQLGKCYLGYFPKLCKSHNLLASRTL